MVPICRPRGLRSPVTRKDHDAQACLNITPEGEQSGITEGDGVLTQPVGRGTTGRGCHCSDAGTEEGRDHSGECGPRRSDEGPEEDYDRPEDGGGTRNRRPVTCSGVIRTNRSLGPAFQGTSGRSATR